MFKTCVFLITVSIGCFGYILAAQSLEPRLSDLQFAKLLTSTNKGGQPGWYPAEIMANFLEKYHYSQGPMLYQAYEMEKDYSRRWDIGFLENLMTFDRSESLVSIAPESWRRYYFYQHYWPDKVLKQLQDPDRPQGVLMEFGDIGHAMGLLIRRGEPGFYDFDIYNSGMYLHNNHPSTTIDGKEKWQTRLRIRIPAENVTSKLINEALKHEENPYHIFTFNHIAGAKIIEQKPEQEIWQSFQKSQDCSLAWIFVYLRHSMELHDYEVMRKRLYRDTLNEILALHKNSKEYAHIIQILEERLERP